MSAAPKSITVSIPLVFEVNPEAWAAEYGGCESVSELRDAVTEYAVSQVSQSPAAEAGAFVNVRLRRKTA